MRLVSLITNAHREMQMYLTIETLTNIVLTTTIFVLLIPMLTKNGQSLGKMILSYQ